MPRFRRRNETFLFALLTIGGATALVAQMDTGEDRTFAYTGHLLADGAAATTPHDFQFALFTNPNADTSCLQTDPVSGCGVWSEAHDNVTVSTGRFSVTLGRGSGDSLTDAVMNNNALYLGMAVRETGLEPNFSVLKGLTELSAVPWAARAAAAKNYTVTGELTADSAVIAGDVRAATATVTGALNAGSLTTTGNIRNTSPSGQMAVSADKVFRDDEFNDNWVRLRNGTNSGDYADFAAGRLSSLKTTSSRSAESCRTGTRGG